MSTATAPRKSSREKINREKVTYMLPPDLIKEIKLEAIDLNIRPAHVVLLRMTESYRHRPRPRDASRTAYSA